MFVSSKPITFTDWEIGLFYNLLLDYEVDIENLHPQLKAEIHDFVNQLKRVKDLIDKIEKSGSIIVSAPKGGEG